MLLISNHLLQYPIVIPAGALIRINIAWIGGVFQLGNILETIKYNVFLDFPEGRQKPPKSNISFQEMMGMVEKHKNVKYVAVSNIESKDVAWLYKQSMPKGVGFVPKIETRKGVDNIQEIISEAKSEYIMLDTEDLFTDVKDATVYLDLVNYIEDVCIKKNVVILKIQGVVFAPWEN
jgi:hypothetical protein